MSNKYLFFKKILEKFGWVNLENVDIESLSFDFSLWIIFKVIVDSKNEHRFSNKFAVIIKFDILIWQINWFARGNQLLYSSNVYQLD